MKGRNLTVEMPDVDHRIMAKTFEIVGLVDVNLVEAEDDEGDGYVGGFGPTEHTISDSLYQYYDGKLHLSAAVSEYMRRHMETRIREEYATLLSRQRWEQKQGG